MKRGLIFTFATCLIIFAAVFLIFFTKNIPFISSQIPDNTTEDLNPYPNVDLNIVTYVSSNELVYLAGTNYFKVYNKTSDTLEDLMGTVPISWLSNFGLNAMVYDPNNSLVYLGGGGRFGAYNRTSNITENLNPTLPPFWFDIYSLAYDTNRSLLYLGSKGKLGIYNRTSNTTVSLEETDPGNWLSSLNVNDLIYDPNTSRIYLGGSSGAFGYYERSSNFTYNLTGTDPGNWLSTLIITSLAYDSNNGLVYLAGGNGVFGAYNKTNGANGTTENLTGVDSGDWIGSTAIRDLVYDSDDTLIYFSGDAGLFGTYNRTTNIMNDLRGVDIANWIGGANNIYGLAYDFINGLFYLVGDNSVFGAYNKTSNSTEDLFARYVGDWIRITSLQNAIFNSNNSLLYLVGDESIFGSYNASNDTLVDLRETDPGDWIGTSTWFGTISGLKAVTYDSDNELIYLAGENGKFGIYNVSDNITYDLTGADTGDWISNNNINALAYDPNNRLVYLAVSKLGVYNRTDGANGTTRNLTQNTGVVSFNDVIYAFNQDLVYFAGGGGETSETFYAYNRSSDTIEDLSDADSGWIGSNSLNALAYDPNDDFVYLGGGGIFGYYDRESNIVYNLSATDPDDWISETGGITDLTYDPNNDLVYMVGSAGAFGVYNKTSNITENLMGTDSDNWIGTTNLNGVIYNSGNELIYLLGDNGIFGVYNRTTNATISVERGTSGNIDIVSSGLLSPTQTETQTRDRINAGESASFRIRNPHIDIRNINLSARTNISNASITVSTNETETRNIQMRFPVGTIYQAFSITSSVSNEELNNVTLEFRVRKTWLEENNRSFNDVVLYRVPSSEDIWEALTTLSIWDDPTYYYFSAISPGFSTFIIFIGELGSIECTPSQTRCFNDELQLCTENRTWVSEEQCKYGCRNGKCLGILQQGKLMYIFLIAVLSIGMIVVLYFVFRYLSKKRSTEI